MLICVHDENDVDRIGEVGGLYLLRGSGELR